MGAPATPNNGCPGNASLPARVLTSTKQVGKQEDEELNITTKKQNVAIKQE